MAGRIRSIKPEIIEDEKVAFLSHLEYRLFIGSWMVADDYGNLRADPDYIRGQVVWASRESRESVAKALDTLVEVRLLDLYVVRGQRYYHVTNWDKHQKVDKPGKPRMPGPKDADGTCARVVTSDSRESREDSEGSDETLATDLRPPTRTTDQDLDHSAPAKPSRKSREPKEPGSFVQARDEWLASYRRRTGVDATFGAKEGKLLSGLLSKHGLYEFVRRLAIFEKHPPDWGPASWDLGMFVSQFDKFAAVPRAPQQRFGAINPNPTQVALDELHRLEREEAEARGAS